ncbi:MAG: HAMP domain-containing sensor histidine kinase [Sphingomicrobium sp.]
MASVPSEPPPVLGRLDAHGRLIAADAPLEALQREAGSSLGETLALPQIAAVAQLARKLGIAVSRAALAGAADHDIELSVVARPEGDEVALSLEGWTVRPAAAPRLAMLLGGESEVDSASALLEWTTDEELRIISLSAALAALIGVEVAEAAGQPLTRLLALDEDDKGEMPLIAGLAARRAFSAQPARGRHADARGLTLSGEVVSSADGAFAGFRGTAQAGAGIDQAGGAGAGAIFDDALDEVLRAPLDRIIDSAERIVERSDGPLRSDYASYGGDIASAARHLVAVIQGMTEDSAQDHSSLDLAALTAEAVVMLEASAEEHGVELDLQSIERLPARGEERGIIQILVNLAANAIHHSPPGATVRMTFAKTPGAASVTIADEGPGIALADQQRIFERFERAHHRAGGTGLGLAISRRLARSMGGDVTLDSAPGVGARFTLTLPTA